MEYIYIETIEDLLSRERDILALFERAYNRPLAPDGWRWLYRDNPNGLAHVTLAVEDGRLMGHYAAIPTLFVRDGAPFTAYRSMTTMVDPASKTPGLFMRLAARAHEALSQSGVSLIYGFPNGNSAHTFERFLKWTLPPSEWIVDVTGRLLLDDEAVRSHLLQRGPVQWALGDARQMRWRLANPQQPIEDLGDLIIKTYEGRPNILHIGAAGLEKIHPQTHYRVMLPASLREGPSRTPVFPYQFGYRWLDKTMAETPIKGELIMSDVF